MNIKSVTIDSLDYKSCALAYIYTHICIWGECLHLYSGGYDSLNNCFRSEQKLIYVNL